MPGIFNRSFPFFNKVASIIAASFQYIEYDNSLTVISSPVVFTDGTTSVRKRISGGYIYIDITLTATGFDGTFGVDWTWMQRYQGSGPVTSVRSGVSDNKFVWDSLGGADDWFLPSRGEVDLMRSELYLFAVGGLSGNYWSSTEANFQDGWAMTILTGAWGISAKTNNQSVRACRQFTAGLGAYNLRDVGPGGGLVFYVNGTTYLEAAPTDQSIAYIWSNVGATLIGTTSALVGTGQANTTAIIDQVGHTASAAKLCDDLDTEGWDNLFARYKSGVATLCREGVRDEGYVIDEWTGSEWDNLVTFKPE